MNIYSIMRNVLPRLCALIVLCALSLSASGQGVVRPTQTGVLDELNQLDGYMVISGVRYDFDSEVTELFLRGEPFDDGNLETGMVVRITIRDGMLIRMEVLGPNNLIRDLDTH